MGHWLEPSEGRTKVRDVQNGFVGDLVQNLAQIACQTDRHHNLCL
jgi:hypothetical protein